MEHTCNGRAAKVTVIGFGFASHNLVEKVARVFLTNPNIHYRLSFFLLTFGGIFFNAINQLILLSTISYC